MAAVFSDDRRYRYRLEREISEIDSGAHGSVCFIMLNPSTADEEHDDPTIRRCIDYARQWGFRRLVVVNLFGYRATDPRALKKAPNPWGEKNTSELIRAAQAADLVVGAWGARGSYRNAGKNTIGLLRVRGIDVKALALTKAGEPVHPLYQRRDLRPEVSL